MIFNCCYLHIVTNCAVAIIYCLPMQYCIQSCDMKSLLKGNDVTKWVTTNCSLCFVAIPMTPPDQTVNVTVGSALTLMVDIAGFNLPLTSITWIEDGQVLMNNTDNITITHGSFAAPPTTSTLVRDPIQSPMNNGTYEVTVMNQAGENMTTYTIIVNGKHLTNDCCNKW